MLLRDVVQTCALPISTGPPAAVRTCLAPHHLSPSFFLLQTREASMKIPSRPTLAGSCCHALLLCLALFTAGAAAATSPADLDQHQSGTKYSPLSQINTGNVGNLELAWEYHTGETPPKDLKNALEIGRAHV